MSDTVRELIYTLLAIFPAVVSFFLWLEVRQDLKHLGPGLNGGKEYLEYEKRQEFGRFCGQLLLVSPGVVALFLPSYPHPQYSTFVTILYNVFGILPFFLVQLVILRNTLNSRVYRQKMIHKALIQMKIQDKALVIAKEQNVRETGQNVREEEQNDREEIQNAREVVQKGGS